MEKQFPKNVRQIGNVCDSPENLCRRLCGYLSEPVKGQSKGGAGGDRAGRRNTGTGRAARSVHIRGLSGWRK